MLKIGIVGLPNVGKSTLFKSITKKQVDCSNYPFCTIDPNIGTVAVPDFRVEELAQTLGSQKKIYTTIEFIDIAGLVEGAHKGEGLGNKFLEHIKETDAIVYILRAFIDENVANTRQNINPIKEKEILNTEMVLKDLFLAEKRIADLEKQMRTGDKETKKELEMLNKARQTLLEGGLLSELSWSKEEKQTMKPYQFLTLKPKLYVLNGKEEEIPVSSCPLHSSSCPLHCHPEAEGRRIPSNTLNNLKENFIVMDIAAELASMDFTPKERQELGLPQDTKINELIKKAYQLLDLITFFTIKSQEARAWAIKKGSTAPQAGGAVHTDFEEKFIKAEVINWKELADSGGIHQARQKGLIRLEGKDYIVQDGDVLEIKAGV